MVRRAYGTVRIGDRSSVTGVAWPWILLGLGGGPHPARKVMCGVGRRLAVGEDRRPVGTTPTAQRGGNARRAESRRCVDAKFGNELARRLAERARECPLFRMVHAWSQVAGSSAGWYGPCCGTSLVKVDGRALVHTRWRAAQLPDRRRRPSRHSRRPCAPRSR